MFLRRRGEREAGPDHEENYVDSVAQIGFLAFLLLFGVARARDMTHHVLLRALLGGFTRGSVLDTGRHATTNRGRRWPPSLGPELCASLGPLLDAKNAG